MKKLYTLSFFLVSFICFSQCPPDDIILNNQNDIDNFSINYPNCTALNAGLTITGSDITNLSPLSVIETVDGNLSIAENPSLLDITGFDSIEDIGQSLYIEDNLSLIDISGFSNLDEIDILNIIDNPSLQNISGFNTLAIAARIDIRRNNNLQDISTFNNLVIVQSYIYIDENPSLLDITGFDSIEDIGQSLYIKDNLSLIDISGFSNLVTIEKDLNIRDNTSLTNIRGFNNLASIGDDFFLRDNTSLIDIIGFNSLESIVGNFKIEDNTSLQDISAFNNLVTFGGKLYIRDNSSLPAISGFNNLVTIEGISIQANYSLLDISGFNSSETILGALDIQGNYSLLDISGFSSLVTIGDDLRIRENFILPDISGFNSLVTITDYLSVDENPSLLDISGFNSLVTIIDGLSVDENPSLQNITGFNNLETAGRIDIEENINLPAISGFNNLETAGRIDIDENINLLDISGFSNLVTIEDYFYIEDNASLLDISGFNSLESIVGNFYIDDNTSLQDISGFNSLESIVGNFYIEDNTSLQDISGFSSLVTIGDNFNIEANSNLFSITGFNSIETIVNTFYIINNSNLNKCNIDYLCNGLNSNIVLSGNSEGCNNLTEACVEICEALENEIITSSTALCPGVTLELSVSNPADSYLWSTGQISETILVNSLRDKQYWVDVTSSGSVCRDYIVINRFSENLTITQLADLVLDSDTDSCSAYVTVPFPTATNSCGVFSEPSNFSPIIPLNFSAENQYGSLIDTPVTINEVELVTTDAVIVEINYKGDFNNSNECMEITGPDGSQVIAICNMESDNNCGSIINPRFTVSQSIWNNWVTTFGSSLTFTLLANDQVNDGGCGSSGPENNFIQLIIQQGTIQITNNQNESYDASGYYPIGTTTVIISASDIQGNGIINSETISFDITVNDNTPPVVLCTENITITDVCSAVVEYPMPTVSDNCSQYGISNLTHVLDLFNSNNTSITGLIPNAFNFEMDGINSYSISDGGNDMYDEGNIISTEYGGPIDYLDNNVTNSTVFGTSGAYVTRKVNNMWMLAADLDGVTEFNIEGNNGADGDGIVNGFTSTLTVGDDSYSIFVKRVFEPEDPSINHLIIIPENPGATQNYSLDTNSDEHQVTGLNGTSRLYYLLYASADGGFIDDATTESIAEQFLVNIAVEELIFTQTEGLTSGSEFPAGTTTNTFEISDSAGNIGSCSFTITVNDGDAPDAVCQNITLPLDDMGMATITANQINFGSSDNCGVDSLELDVDTFDCSNIGENTVTLTVSDASGNSATCTAIVTVNDTDAPVLSCTSGTSNTSDDGTGDCTSLSPSNNGSFDIADNCSGSLNVEVIFTGAITQTLSLNIPQGSEYVFNEAYPVGITTHVVTVTDTSGNSASCTYTTTVLDDEAPTWVNPPADLTVECDGVGNVTQFDEWLNNTFTGADNCGSVTITSTSLGLSDTCGGTGTEETVTFTLTDANNNATMLDATFTIEDTTPAVIVCPGNLTAFTEDVNCGAIVFLGNPIAIEECGSVTVYQTAGLDSGSVFPVGDTLIEYTAEDECGNLATCEFIVTVIDDDAPEAICQDLTVILDDTGNASIVVDQINLGSNDNCGVESLAIDIDTFDCSNVGANEVTLTVTDIHGNTATCVSTVTVLDNTAPIAICQDITLELGADGTVTIDPMDIAAGSSDACGIATYELDIDTFDCSNVGTNSVILTVTDVNGNQSSCAATVTLEDNSAPVLVCSDVTVELNQDGVAFITPSLVADITDNCGTSVVTINVQEVSCADIGTPLTVTVFANDGSGNSASCAAVVTVVDLLAPEIVCPDDQAVNLDPNGTHTLGNYIADGSATATDNCTDPVTVFTQDPAAGTVLGFGTQVITFTAEDEYGNVSTCSFELDIQEILGSSDLEDFTSLMLYPNPAKNKVNLSNPRQIDLSEVTIYDLTGRIVNKVDLTNMGSEITIDVSTLANAPYLLLIKGNQGTSTKQLIVNN